MLTKLVLCDDISKNIRFNINTDGTTKQQRKLGSIAINGMVISVNELSDGSASSTISDISQELEQLRCTAKASYQMQIVLTGQCWFHQLQTLHPPKRS